MTIFVKNKHTLQIDEFKFRCCIGKKGLTKNKRKEIKKHPKGRLKLKIFILEKTVKKNHQLY